MFAHISEVREDKSPPVDAAGAAGGAEGGAEGGAKGGAEAPVAAGNAGQQGQGLPAGPRQQGQPNPIQPPPQPSRNSPRLNDITNNTIKPFVSDIETALGENKKNILSATYRVKKYN